ncbi:MAG: ABC transporter permease [Candidatus Thorarchaeota archaeon]
MEAISNYSEEITESKKQFLFLGLLLLVNSMAAIIFGGSIVTGNLVYSLQPLLGISQIPPAYLSSWPLQGLIVLVIGYVMFRIALAVDGLHIWAFSMSMYLNTFLIVVYLTIGTIGIPLIALSLFSIILLFLPAIRGYWYPSFKEDMAPRAKETRFTIHLILKSPLVVVGIIIIVSFVVLAFLAPYIAPYGAEQRIWADSNLPPGSPSNNPDLPDHIWGTDDSGGDVFSRILYAAQVDLRISVTIVLVAVTIGTLIGAVAGYYGGKIDELVMRVTDVFFAFPGLVLAMAIVMALGERSLDNISIALMTTWWPGYARLVRGQVLAEREKLYVEAARSVGASDIHILLSHIIPNTIQPLIVQATMDTGGVLLTAAGLSFIGFGPPAGIAEWGLMISIGQGYFTLNPWAVFFPGIAILLVALAFNLVGDGIRDIMDPKLRRR